MNIEMKDIITLDDDNEYVVTSKTNYEDKTYYFLVDKNNVSNIKFCYEDKDELVESSNKELNTKLLPLFYKTMKDIIPEN